MSRTRASPVLAHRLQIVLKVLLPPSTAAMAKITLLSENMLETALSYVFVSLPTILQVSMGQGRSGAVTAVGYRLYFTGREALFTRGFSHNDPLS